METSVSKSGDLKISIYNLSSQDITDGEISLLKLGTKFVPVTLVPPEDSKVDILRFSRKLLLHAMFFDSEYSDVSVVKPKSCYIPKSVKSQVLKGIVEDLEVFANDFPQNMDTLEVRDNLSIDQRIGLKVFKKRDNILYFKADKGSGVVLLNELFYKYKVLEMLNTDKYEKLPRNVDYFVMLKLKTFVNKYKDLFTSAEKRAITKLDYRTTNIYGLPKIHKSQIIKQVIKNAQSAYLHLPDPLDLKFRLIFGGPKNPCSVLAELLNSLLNLFRDKVQSRLKDVYDFKSKIPKFTPQDIPFIEIVSLDVVSLYESLQQNLGLPGLRYFLTRHKNLLPSRFSVEFVIEAMKFILNNNTGYFNGEIYRQVTGTATGIKPAPPYADLAMGYLEIQLFYKIRAKMGLKVASYFWNNYMRFLDDGIILWDKRVCDFGIIFDLMNAIDVNINFTIERSDTSVKFLDVLIYKTCLGFKTVVQGKETDSETFLPFTSSHPRHCRENIPFSMAKRVRALTDEDDKAWHQMSELSSRLLKAGYPVGLVHSAVQDAMALSIADLQKSLNKDSNDDIMAFVHTYDPAHPALLWEIKNLVSRLFTSVECKRLFANTKIIDSRREPSNLLRVLQHSRFDESGSAAYNKGVSKCGMKNCKLCLDILETDSVFFSNAGFSLRVNAKMDCTARNVVYALFCGGCSHSYIGETVCLRDRATAHRSNSKSEDRAVMEVSRHLLNCGMGFKICPIYKLKEECKILRLVVEDNLIKLLRPDLNTDRRNLLHLQIIE